MLRSQPVQATGTALASSYCTRFRFAMYSLLVYRPRLERVVGGGDLLDPVITNDGDLGKDILSGSGNTLNEEESSDTGSGTPDSENGDPLGHGGDVEAQEVGHNLVRRLLDVLG